MRLQVLLVLLALIYFANCQLDASSCLYRKKGIIWDIGNLSNTTDYEAIDPNDATTKVVFNICRQVENKCKDNSYAVLRKTDFCSPLTNSNNSPSVSEIDDEDLVLTYKYTGDLNCKEDPSQKYSFELKLLWSDSDVTPRYVKNADSPCAVKVEWRNTKGCPWIKANALWSYFHKYKFYLAPTVLIIGLFYLLLGGYFGRTSIFLITFATVVFIILAIVYGLILSYKTPEWVGWIVLSGAAVLGFIAALFTSTFIKTGVMLIGAWAGGMAGSCLFQSIVYLLSDYEYALWIWIAIFAIVGAVLTLKFFRIVLGVGTSFIGGFMLWRGIAFYAGGYPNEFQLHNEIRAGDYENVPYTVYIYIVCMILVSVLAIIFKHKKFKLFNHDNDNKGGYFSVNN